MANPALCLPMEKHPSEEMTTPEVPVLIEMKDGRRLFGTFKGWTDGKEEVIIQLFNGAVVYEPTARVAKGWWPPAGWRP